VTDAPATVPSTPTLAERFRGAAARLAGARRRTVGLVYPPSCIACGGAVADPHGLCAQCWGGIGFIERPFCERLGTPFAVDLGTPLLSPAAMADPPVFRRARAVARYDGVARKLVHRLKYGDRVELSLTLGRMMARAGQDVIAEADIVVPVPLHWLRLWTRRFNQAAALARVISRLSGVPLEAHALRRRKRTRQQVGLSKAERAANVQGAFAVPQPMRPVIQGKRVLLVDDVITTGSTANAASRILMRGGAACVDVLAFARTVHDG
jgi:ComF family protein